MTAGQFHLGTANILTLWQRLSSDAGSSLLLDSIGAQRRRYSRIGVARFTFCVRIVTACGLLRQL